MTIQRTAADDGEISLFTLVTDILERRWSIIKWITVGAFAAGVLASVKPPQYDASASFIPQGNEPSRSGIASIAGQLGVVLPTSTQSTSPDFYVKLITSRVLLEKIAQSDYSVPEVGGRRMTFMELFKIPKTPPKRRLELAVQEAKSRISPSVVKATGVVEINVATRWPSVSLAIVNALLDGVNEFNVKTRQSQAAAERRFVDSRLTVAGAELRSAEDRLAQFLMTNRQSAVATLSAQRERLQRDVLFRQQLYMSLAQGSEDVRIREVRDIPVITVFEPPSVRTVPEPRGRFKAALLGALLGAFIGISFALVRALLRSGHETRDIGIQRFMNELARTKTELFSPRLWFRRRSGSPTNGIRD